MRTTRKKRFNPVYQARDENNIVVESREKFLERVLREMLWCTEEVKKIALRDREKTDVEHIASLLDTRSVYEALNIKTGLGRQEKKDE